MKITKEETKYHKYALESKYDQTLVDYCIFLKQTFGWQEYHWDMQEKKWRFKDPELIIMLKDKFKDVEFGDGIEKDLKIHAEDKIKTAEQANNAIRIKEATTSSLEIKGIKGDLYEYQKLGVEFLVNSGGRAMLTDAPGVGKSAQALGFITHNDFKRNLIVCPASVKYSWENEIKKWTNMKSYVVDSKTKLEDIPFEIQCIIINYDILKKFHNELKKYKFDVLVGDEVQMIKSSTAIRSKAFKSIAKDIPNVIMLTGTPLLSRPIEMFNMLNIIDQRTWNNYYSYATKYCEGRQGNWGFEAKGASNLPELKTKIEKYFLRRTKEEVLKELPPKNFIEIPIYLPKEHRKQYDLIERDLVEYLKGKDKTDKEIAKSMQAEKLVRLNYLREINALGKIDTARELIDNIIESGEKVLVFSSFNTPLIDLAEEYDESSVMIIGSTPVDERGEAVKKFQEDPNIKVFFGGTKSAGSGITLTEASNVIFLDLPWNPADIEQCENRAHRPGAEYESLNIYTIISRDSIDGFMKKLLSEKQKVIDQLFGGKEIKKDTAMVEEYIKLLELKYDKQVK